MTFSLTGGTETMTTARLLCTALGLLLALPASAPPDAQAAAYPSKPITVFNSSTAGSPTDVMARQVGQHIRGHLGQQFVVVNKPGGGGGVMFAALFAEPADGYTIASLTAAQVTGLHAELKKDFSFADLEFIANVQREPNCLAVKYDSPLKSLPDLIEAARKTPSFKVGGQGTGSALHLMVLLLGEKAGVKFTWVPLGGGSESVTNLLGGTVPVIATAPATVNQYVEAKQMRILAVSGEQRLPHLQDVPTFRELGHDIVITQWRGFAARKGFPAAAKATLADAIKRAVAEPGFKEFMAKNRQPDGYLGPEEFSRVAREDFELMGRLLQGLKK